MTIKRIVLHLFYGMFAAVFMCGASHAYQTVIVEEGKLMTDFDQDGTYEPYFVKGVGYGAEKIGSFPAEWGQCAFTGYDSQGQPQYACPPDVPDQYEDPVVLDRDLPLIKAMNANTIRTWGKVTPLLLDGAEANGLKVIAGYWIPHNLDYIHGDLGSIEADILSYVGQFKDDPAILMWGLSNENEFNFCTYPGADSSCDREAQANAFYAFVNHVAGEIKDLEGESAHPVMIVSADLGDIGGLADDDSLPNIDLHGCNVYRGADFGTGNGNFFDNYQVLSSKPVLITEFGLDAWFVLDPANPSDGVEREDLQADYVSESWDVMLANNALAGGPCLGGVVFQYTDGWWKSNGAWSPSAASHDYDYLPDWYFGPDGYVNEEWFGITANAPAVTPGQPDAVFPRLAYDALAQSFTKEIPGAEQPQQPWSENENGNLSQNIGWNYTMGYHFEPQTSGRITRLGGYFNGTKAVSLWNKSTGQLLAQTQVTSANSWSYADIDEVNIQPGVQYTVAVYLAGSGASRRTNIQTLPQTYGDIRILGSTYCSRDRRPTNTVTSTMYGQADITFVADE